MKPPTPAKVVRLLAMHVTMVGYHYAFWKFLENISFFFLLNTRGDLVAINLLEPSKHEINCI